MFTAAGRNILRWGTPDPEGDWMMEGHILIREDSRIVIDPPLVPGLLDSIERLGKLEAVILTTLDHTRGAKFISKKTGARLLLPDQDESLSVNPGAIIEQKEIREFEKYSEGEVYGMKAFRLKIEGERTSEIPWMDEYSLLTRERQLIVGDIAIGDSRERLVLAPEWFPHDPPHKPYEPARREFSRLVREAGAETLLASHGCNLYGTLGRLV